MQVFSEIKMGKFLTEMGIRAATKPCRWVEKLVSFVSYKDLKVQKRLP